MKSVTVSVPGKVILMGDHAVVHGKPAVVAAIDRRLSVTAQERAPSAGGERVTVSCSVADTYVRHAAGVVARMLDPESVTPVRITVDSGIEPGYHLGSSAAVAAGVAGALLYLWKGIWNPVEANRIAYEIEKAQHGTPSGVDNTTVTMGGFVWYRKELEFLKSLWQIPVKLPPALDRFCLIDAGKPEETTGEMVALVRHRTEQYPSRMQRIFADNELQTKRIAVAIKNGDEAALMDAMRSGERTLERMGVVSPYARRIVRAVEQTGGAAKILGGGGKKHGVGFLLSYHPDGRALTAVAATFGQTAQHVTLGGDGMKLERKNTEPNTL